ncbi:MAG: 2-oxoacid:acceptor oxidoreductase subunit alpha, partial [Verrucomicrobia bacterium]
PAEIRAPAGTPGGVSAYQLNFADEEVSTPGDAPYVLVAMNPAALKVNLGIVQKGGIIILNTDEFTPANLAKAGFETNPLEDGSLKDFQVVPVPMTKLNDEATKDSGLPPRQRARCKNFFALGITLWLYDRPMQPVLEWMMRKFGSKPQVLAANAAALRAGYNFANTSELLRVHYRVAPAKLPRGRYRRVNGNEAVMLGLVAAACKAGRPLIYASYPITPASEILHELAAHKHYDVRTIQCEDEIAAACAALGASYAGCIGATGTSGPGLALKAETLGLAVMTELPLVVVDVQRAGPSTGLPTKSEQADLLMAMHGRHGEAPAVVLAPGSPGDCFWMAYEAVRLAVKYMTPVIVLSDGFLANSSEAFPIPDTDKLPPITVPPLPPKEEFAPYRRDPETLVRPWAPPGTEGYQHRIGGLEKQDVTGNVSYDGDNHEKMVNLRRRKVEGIARDLPPAKVEGDPEGELLLVGWGSTEGAIKAAVRAARAEGHSVSHLHLRYLNPLQPNVGEILRRFRRILVPENNLGQLCGLLRSRFLVDARPFSGMKGRPFLIREIRNAIEEALKS